MTEITETSLLLIQWNYLSLFRLKFIGKKTSDLICSSSWWRKPKKKKHSRLQQNPSTGMPQRAFRIQSNRSVVFPALSYGIFPFGFPELRNLSLSSFWNHTNTHTHTVPITRLMSFPWLWYFFLGRGGGLFQPWAGTYSLRSHKKF